jgi:hypothetical protein
LGGRFTLGLSAGQPFSSRPSGGQKMDKKTWKIAIRIPKLVKLDPFSFFVQQERDTVEKVLSAFFTGTQRFPKQTYCVCSLAGLLFC